MLRCSTLLLAVTPLMALAADPVADTARMATDIKVLASDAFEGRAPGTSGEEKTVGWIIGQMIAAGLEPGGDLHDGQRAWTQDARLARFEIEGTPSAAFSVGGRSIPLTQGEGIALRAAQTNADHVALDNVPVVFAGYGVRAPEREWDDFAGVDVKGKVVVVLVNDPDFESGKGDFGGRAMTYYGRWTYKYEEAARLGAAGLLVVHETAPAAYGWATVQSSNTIPMFDIVREDPASAHVPVEAWIQRAVAVELFRRAGLDFEALKKKAAKRGFRAVALPGTTFSARFDVAHAPVMSKNVLGVLPGTSRPDEHVIYSAHWDHLGIGPPDARGDTVYNGAVDDASGVAALLELARMHAGAPRVSRSVVFLATTAEERGLLGAEYYAANPVYPLETTVADLNIDGWRPFGPAHDFGTAGDAAVTLTADLVKVLEAHGRVLTPDAHPEAGQFFRADHFPFAKQGVPALTGLSGLDLVEGGRAAGEAAYDAFTKARYHQPADEWSDDWDFGSAVQDIAVLYTLGRELASSRRWPEWSPGSEFKAVRDASAARRTR